MLIDYPFLVFQEKIKHTIDDFILHFVQFTKHLFQDFLMKHKQINKQHFFYSLEKSLNTGSKCLQRKAESKLTFGKQHDFWTIERSDFE